MILLIKVKFILLYHIFVILLTKPQGFENPFVDEIVKECVIYKEFPIKESITNKMVAIEWELPANSTCFAIRIQSKGIHSLIVQKFQCLQGDEIVSTSEEDLQVSANSRNNNITITLIISIRY